MTTNSKDRRVLLAPLLAASIAGAAALAACGTQPRTDEPDPAIAGLVHVCSSCHADRGRSEDPTFPRLAGQQRDYLANQLRAFRDRTRADPHAHTYMWGMAAKLTDAQIAGLADYYSSQTPAPGVAAPATESQEVAAGRQIFEEGIAATEVPACVACHGEAAAGNGEIPRLAGQHRAYLTRQLEAFASKSRANDIMHETSKHLRPEDIRAVTAYLATL